MSDLRYPIGKWPKDPFTPERKKQWIEDVAGAPARLRAAVEGLSPQQLDTPYRDGGWTVRQVVHHVPESHMNAYIRFKLALTEDVPTIKPYAEDLWAKLDDVPKTPIEVSLALLENLHERWVILLRSLSDQDFARKFRHPEIGELTLGLNLGLYAWHGKHHVAHITSLRERMGWNKGVATAR
ncbi:MAG TPA: bacillithiol transferase BstA [Terriglobales bacterium]|nr:bacillithiol transferase BstA [Terriglobales bacterium]